VGDLWGTGQAAIHLKEVETILNFASLLRHRVKIALMMKDRTQRLCGKLFPFHPYLEKEKTHKLKKHLLSLGSITCFPRMMEDGCL